MKKKTWLNPFEKNLRILIGLLRLLQTLPSSAAYYIGVFSSPLTAWHWHKEATVCEEAPVSSPLMPACRPTHICAEHPTKVFMDDRNRVFSCIRRTKCICKATCFPRKIVHLQRNTKVNRENSAYTRLLLYISMGKASPLNKETNVPLPACSLMAVPIGRLSSESAFEWAQNQWDLCQVSRLRRGAQDMEVLPLLSLVHPMVCSPSTQFQPLPTLRTCTTS